MTASTSTPDEYATPTALIRRGWTDKAIRKFLGEPDHHAINPLYRTAAPMRLYSLARAVTAEATAEWRAWRGAATARSRAAADLHRARVLAEVADLEIRVPVMDLDVLAAAAVEHRNERARLRDWDCDPATVDGVPPETLHRWMVNFLRHQHTEYDGHLKDLSAKIGRAPATELIRAKVYTVIADTYPTLADETRRQLAERQEQQP